MSFLLKIVQGPQYGAEIALVEGINLSVGRSDDCDIVLNDAFIAEKAFELEVTDERVVAILPDGKDIKFEPFHVVTIGTTSFVVGPAEGAWKELVWPEAEKTAEDQETIEESADRSLSEKSRPRRLVWLFILLLLVVVGFTLLLFCLKHREASKEYFSKAVTWVKRPFDSSKNSHNGDAPAVSAVKTLADIAGEYGFSVTDNGGRMSAKGDFKTRIERLEATAQAYAVQPGLSVDFSDAETLKNATDELLMLVGEGRLKTATVEGRKVFLEGSAPSQVFLRRVLEALSADVPKIIAVDCSRVTLGAVESKAVTNEEASTRYKLPRIKAERSKIKNQESAHPEMPVAGILTVPYPCLVLSDGSRAMEGARFGDYVIEKIEPDCVTVRGSEGIFIWRP